MEGDGREAGHRHGCGDVGGFSEQLEQGEDHRHEQHRHQDERHASHQNAHDYVKPQQGLAQVHDLLPTLAFANGLAHDDRCGVTQAEAHHQEQPAQVAHDGAGRQHLHGIVGIAQDNGQQGVAQAPGSLVQHHRGGILQKPVYHLRSRPQKAVQVQGDVFAAERAEHADNDLADPGQQGGDSRAPDAQCGEAAVTEDQQIVQPDVQNAGEGKDLHAEAGILHIALGAGVDGGEHVEHIGKADDLQIRRAQQTEVVAVGQQIHHRHGEQGEDRRQCQSDAASDQACHAQGTVDAFQITLAPVLAHQDSQAALNTEYDAGEQKHRHVGRRDGGHFLVAELTDHKGVDEPQGKGNEILQDHGQGQFPQPFVKAGFPAEKVEHGKILL